MLRARRALAFLLVMALALGAAAAFVALHVDPPYVDPPHVGPHHVGSHRVEVSRIGPYSFAVTARRPAGAAAGRDCPAGWLCLYAGPDFGYPRAHLRPCGSVELAPYGWSHRVRSVHSNLTDPADLAPPFDKVWFYMHPAPGEAVSIRHLLASVDGIWTSISDSSYLPFAEYLRYDCERRKRLQPPVGAVRGPV
ncbi:peptidase inhibitor family I36 protein [Virgisporangium aurantiacum]|nr:peptidase inhibitor family I36 protein [Virgisporangium aurantiacum]